MPMLLPAPGLLSTITGWPNSSDRRLAMMRETVSVPPPGGNGAIRRMMRALGQACANAPRSATLDANADAAESCTHRRRVIMGLLRRLDVGVLDHLGPLGDLGLDVGVDALGR